MAASTASAREAPEAAERVLVITRMFDAPRALVFKAWSEPERARHWMGPRGFAATHFERDARVGGAWRVCLREEASGRELWQGGTFREIVPPERLVYTFAWDRDDGSRGHETLITITFAEQGGKTKMTFRQATFETVGQRDAHRGGWSSSFDRLAEYAAGPEGR
jgi:uncharacterized protein YndB with AHSA1/START domain